MDSDCKVVLRLDLEDGTLWSMADRGLAYLYLGTNYWIVYPTVPWGFGIGYARVFWNG